MLALSSSAGPAGPAGVLRPQPPAVPAPWEAVWCTEHDEYYFWNRASGETSWDLPVATQYPVAGHTSSGPPVRGQVHAAHGGHDAAGPRKPAPKYWGWDGELVATAAAVCAGPEATCAHERGSAPSNRGATHSLSWDLPATPSHAPAQAGTGGPCPAPTLSLKAGAAYANSGHGAEEIPRLGHPPPPSLPHAGAGAGRGVDDSDWWDLPRTHNLPMSQPQAAAAGPQRERRDLACWDMPEAHTYLSARDGAAGTRLERDRSDPWFDDVPPAPTCPLGPVGMAAGHPARSESGFGVELPPMPRFLPSPFANARPPCGHVEDFDCWDMPQAGIPPPARDNVVGTHPEREHETNTREEDALECVDLEDCAFWRVPQAPIPPPRVYTTGTRPDRGRGDLDLQGVARVPPSQAAPAGITTLAPAWTPFADSGFGLELPPTPSPSSARVGCSA